VNKPEPVASPTLANDPLAGIDVAPPAPLAPPKPRSWKRDAVLTLGALGAAIGGWLSSSGSSSDTAAQRAAALLVHQGRQAALAIGSFHYVSTSVASSVTQVTVGDAGTTQGRQAITVGSSSFIVLVVGQTVAIDPALQKALTRAKAAGTAIFCDNTCRKELVKDFTPLGIAFDKVENDPSVWQDDSAYTRFRK